MRGTLIAAGGAVFATAALAATLAGPATAYAHNDRSADSCSLETQEVKTWQEVHGHHVSQGTRDAAACADRVRHARHHGYDSWALRYALGEDDDWRLDD